MKTYVTSSYDPYISGSEGDAEQHVREMGRKAFPWAKRLRMSNYMDYALQRGYWKATPIPEQPPEGAP